MKGRTKKERRAIGKLVRWLRKMQRKGLDEFRYDKHNGRVIAFQSSELQKVGQLMPTRYMKENDDTVMAFQTMMYANAFISERDKGLCVMPVINNVEQIYTLDVDKE
ncbi:MAG: hypothetical protein IJ640_10415 [Prevotella sp.]|nr:hypothetical protein [Prevotella sp.]